MSSIVPHRAQELGTIPAMRPGWPEIFAGITVWAIVGLGGGALLVQSALDPAVVSIALSALSGIAGLAGFAVAARIRIRSWSAFGIRPVAGRWLVIGVAAGVIAFLAKGLAVMSYSMLTGQDANPQEIFATGARGGMAMIIISTLLMGILTPIGEEFLFRGVLTNALLRYGPFIGVGGSAVVFALLHGISIIFPAALVAGLVAGEVFRRSASIWPGVIVHVMFNLPTIPALLLVGASQ